MFWYVFKSTTDRVIQLIKTKLYQTTQFLNVAQAAIKAVLYMLYSTILVWLTMHYAAGKESRKKVNCIFCVQNSWECAIWYTCTRSLNTESYAKISFRRENVKRTKLYTSHSEDKKKRVDLVIKLNVRRKKWQTKRIQEKYGNHCEERRFLIVFSSIPFSIERTTAH